MTNKIHLDLGESRLQTCNH